MPSSPNSGSRRRNPRWRSWEPLQKPLGAGQHASEPPVAGAGYTKRARKGFEQGFDLVMAGAPVKDTGMNVRARAACETLKEVGYQFRLQITDSRRADLGLDHGHRSAAKVHCCQT